MKLFFATDAKTLNPGDSSGTRSNPMPGTMDDQLLAQELIRRGHRVEFKDWNELNVPWQDADGVMIRSTWDYYRKRDAFLSWAERVAAVTRQMNSLEIVRWNSSKLYLKELASRGVPTVPTVFTSDPEVAVHVARSLLEKLGRIILKPAISATADLTFSVRDPERLLELVPKVLERSQVLIQPFIASVETHGELSLVYFRASDGYRFSHSLLKKAVPGDFRVQSEFGGSIESGLFTEELHQLATHALSQVPSEALYARVDVVDWKTEPKLGELELIEPDLYFRTSPDSVRAAADAIERRIQS